MNNVGYTNTDDDTNNINASGDTRTNTNSIRKKKEKEEEYKVSLTKDPEFINFVVDNIKNAVTQKFNEFKAELDKTRANLLQSVGNNTSNGNSNLSGSNQFSNGINPELLSMLASALLGGQRQPSPFESLFSELAMRSFISQINMVNSMMNGALKRMLDIGALSTDEYNSAKKVNDNLLGLPLQNAIKLTEKKDGNNVKTE